MKKFGWREAIETVYEDLRYQIDVIIAGKITGLITQIRKMRCAHQDRIEKLELTVKQLCCKETGHDYTKWERIEEGWGYGHTSGIARVYVAGTCDCGHQVHRHPTCMKPAEKKRFLDMGLVNKDDFPVKTKKK